MRECERGVRKKNSVCVCVGEREREEIDTVLEKVNLYYVG